MTTPSTLPTTWTKSAQITSLDLTPPVRDTAGQGGAGRLITKTGLFTIPLDLATTAGIRMVRIPSNAIVKAVKFGVEAAGGTLTTLTATIGLAFSDNPLDGTGVNYNNSQLFSCSAFASTTSAGYAMAAAAKDLLLDVTYRSQTGVSTFTDGYFTMGASTMPIWLAISQGGPGPQTVGAWGGLGAASLSTVPSYHLSADPGGFFDVFLQPTTTTNLSAAMNGICEVHYVTT